MSWIVAANVVGLALSQVAAQDRISLGDYLVGGSSVPVTFPIARLEPDPGASIEFQGKHYTVQADGTIGQAIVADGFWGEFAAGYKAAKDAEGSEWRTKIIIITSADLAEVQPSTGVRFRRGSIEPAQMPEVLGGIARWAAMVRAATGGKVTPTIDLSIDDTPERKLLAADDPTDFDEKYLQAVIAPRLNAAAFDADDKTYRGPYHGAFVIHAGRTDPVKLAAVQATPVSAVSWYTKPALADGDRLALTLFGSWVRQTTWRAAQAGYRINPWFESLESPFASVANPIVPDACWQNLLQMNPPQNAARKALAKAVVPDKLPANTWQLAALDAPAFVPMRGALVTKTGSKCRAWVATGMAPYFEANVQPAYGFKVAGRAQVGAELAVAFDCPADKFPDSAGQYFLRKSDGRLAAAPPTSNATVSATPLTEALSSEGMMKVEQVSDAEKGTIYRLTERGFVRTGKAQLMASTGGFELGDHRALTLTFRQSAADPVAIQLDWTSGLPTVLVLDAVTVPPLGVSATGDDVMHFPLQALNQWQTVRIDLSPTVVRHPNARITRIWVTPAPFYEYAERSQLQSATFELLPPTFSAINGSETMPSSSAANEITTKAAAMMATLDKADASDLAASALTDPNRAIRATASYVLAKKPASQATPSLLDEVRSGFAWNSMLAIKALCQQQTPLVSDALRRALEIGPLDHQRLAAALEVGRLGDSAFAGSLSLLYVSRDWQVRRAAVEALSKLNTRDAGIIMTTYGKDPDPVVRLAFVTKANPSDELVARRLQYLAVNDVSEAVRLAAALNLINSGSPALAKEGFAAVRDDSWWVREQVLLSIKSADQPEARVAIQQGVADSDARVRAAAVIALKTATKIDMRELGDISSEQDPRVIAALRELQKAGKITLPSSLDEESFR